jgi:hypothetical protein
MDAPLPVALRSDDRDDRMVEAFAALALIAPDEDTVGHVLELALGTAPRGGPPDTNVEPTGASPNV